MARNRQIGMRSANQHHFWKKSTDSRKKFFSRFGAKNWYIGAIWSEIVRSALNRQIDKRSADRRSSQPCAAQLSTS